MKKACFTKKKSLLTKILIIAGIQFQGVTSQQNFALTMTAQLSCHVQNFVAIVVLKLNEIFIEFEICVNKKHRWNEPQV